MPDSLPPVPLEPFAGPLDLLLDEVRRQKVPIEEVEIAPLAARFLAYMRSAARCQLNLHIEWAYMAATLIQWKSRSLLPADPAAPPAPDPVRDDLLRQLALHRKEAAGDLGGRLALAQARFARPLPDTGEGGEPAAAPPPFVSVWDLLQQARELARWASEHRAQQRSWAEVLAIEEEEVTTGEMIGALRGRLAQAEAPLDGLRLLEEEPTAARRSCLFLAMLEMARDQELRIAQEEAFGGIWIRVYEGL